MASFAGSSASPDKQKQSIIQMIIDGVQGTSSGEGLVQGIDKYGNIYEVGYPFILAYAVLKKAN